MTRYQNLAHPFLPKKMSEIIISLLKAASTNTREFLGHFTDMGHVAGRAVGGHRRGVRDRTRPGKPWGRRAPCLKRRLVTGCRHAGKTPIPVP
jgi:hypothetical protein